MQLLILCCALFLAACTASPRIADPSPASIDFATVKPQPSAPLLPALTFTVIATAATPFPTATVSTSPLPATPTLTQPAAPENWQDWPVIPTVSEAMRVVYHNGLALGNNTHAFSKVGDCETVTKEFMGSFDLSSPTWYTLGTYTNLQEVINQFTGSFSRVSLASKTGFNTASVLSTMWSDPAQCQDKETPLDCEYRLHRPSLVIIMLGTNDYETKRATYEANMRKIIQFWLDKGVVPILSTKADNLEGDGSINAIIVRLAGEYQLPLWNFWRAVQDLPGQGLQDDRIHLTFAHDFFDNPDAMQNGWPVRNLTGLQVLDTVWRWLSQ